MSEALHKRIVQAIADPGHFTARADDYTESIPSWGARAVVIALGIGPKMSEEVRVAIGAVLHGMVPDGHGGGDGLSKDDALEHAGVLAEWAKGLT
jgi:hypothetical protein